LGKVVVFDLEFCDIWFPVDLVLSRRFFIGVRG